MTWRQRHAEQGTGVRRASATPYPAQLEAGGRAQAEKFLGWWLDAADGISRTPAFASYMGPTGALRNQANAALLAWIYARGSGGGPGKLQCRAEFQVGYAAVLGRQAGCRAQATGAACQPADLRRRSRLLHAYMHASGVHVSKLHKPLLRKCITCKSQSRLFRQHCSGSAGDCHERGHPIITCLRCRSATCLETPERALW